MNRCVRTVVNLTSLIGVSKLSKVERTMGFEATATNSSMVISVITTKEGRAGG